MIVSSGFALLLLHAVSGREFHQSGGSFNVGVNVDVSNNSSSEIYAEEHPCTTSFSTKIAPTPDPTHSSKHSSHPCHLTSNFPFNYIHHNHHPTPNNPTTITYPTFLIPTVTTIPVFLPTRPLFRTRTLAVYHSTTPHWHRNFPTSNCFFRPIPGPNTSPMPKDKRPCTGTSPILYQTVYEMPEVTSISYPKSARRSFTSPPRLPMLILSRQKS